MKSIIILVVIIAVTAAAQTSPVIYRLDNLSCRIVAALETGGRRNADTATTKGSTAYGRYQITLTMMRDANRIVEKRTGLKNYFKPEERTTKGPQIMGEIAKHYDLRTLSDYLGYHRYGRRWRSVPAAVDYVQRGLNLKIAFTQ